ncbi:MAG TPA: ribonuclease III [Ktedonobacterales bacterium]|nr:ribonuclease III [Ktedonobacterales bacterium]
MSDLTELEEKLGIVIQDKRLLERAFTHHSTCPETANVDAYDPLEFLGDAVLGAYVVEYIYRTSPGASEGEMTALKSEAVSRRTLAEIGKRLNLIDYVRIDLANLRTFNERSKESLSADLVESLVGAIHLDQGPEASRAFVEREVLPIVEQVRGQLHENNPKGRLQQAVLRSKGTLPRYHLLKQGGNSNDRVYTVGVYVGDSLLATGTASSIKEAGRLAAREALRAAAEAEIAVAEAEAALAESDAGTEAPDLMPDVDIADAQE